MPTPVDNNLAHRIRYRKDNSGEMTLKDIMMSLADIAEFLEENVARRPPDNPPTETAAKLPAMDFWWYGKVAGLARRVAVWVDDDGRSEAINYARKAMKRYTTMTNWQVSAYIAGDWFTSGLPGNTTRSEDKGWTIFFTLIEDQS